MALIQDLPLVFLYPLLAGLLICVLSILSMLIGGFPLGDAVADVIDGTAPGDLLGWLNLGRVPFSIILILMTVSFGVTGMLITQVIPAMPVWIGVILAVPVAVVVTKLAGNGIARIMPQDATTAVSTLSLVGKVGRVSRGPLDSGAPGIVRVADEHGEFHNLAARPADAAAVIPERADIVVVAPNEKEKGVFFVMPFDTGA